MARRAKFLILAGILLIALSLGTLLLTHLLSKKAAHDTQTILTQLDQLLTERTAGLPGTYRNAQMPVLQLGGQDLIAVLELPDYGVRLPVCARWDRGSALGIPRRFTGSAYDGSLIIGGSDRTGQFDCLETVPLDARIIITDMTGAEFTYRVARIQRADSADSALLTDGDWDLTLFTRGTTSMEYLLLRCTH